MLDHPRSPLAADGAPRLAAPAAAAPPRPSATSARWLRWRPEASVEAVAVVAALWFGATCNGAFWHGFAAAVAPGAARAGLTAAALFVAIAALHAALLCLVLNRWTLKPMLTLLLFATAAAAFFMDHYGVYFDADMLRNVLHTEPKEAGELLTPALLPPLLLRALLPALLVWRLRLRRRPPGRALLRRAAAIVAALAIAAGATLGAFQDIASLMRGHPELRYLITPGNLVAGLVRVGVSGAEAVDVPRQVVGGDAVQVVSPGRKPRLLVVVVGETVRARNWGLNGYARQTTPELAALDVVNFPDVTSCGSATEVSLPCMFSAYGRRDYDRDAIEHSDSLLHVLDRAGVATLWRDNQTGCKGVCAGLPFESFLDAHGSTWCDGRRCFDEILLEGLDAKLAAGRDQVIVLHPLGNHGPAYASRYPPQFRRFVPTCDTAELGDCRREEIVNAYDNAVLYADHLLARTVRFLQSRHDVDTAMIYVADHGESLGENGLYLHGVPYAIAPEEQVTVPMVIWLSRGMQRDAGIDRACLQRRAALPASHDNLFSTVLGLMQVRTLAYAPALDLLAGCRSGTAP